jgi:hypothetical protein
MLLRLCVPTDRGFADRYDQRLHGRRVERELLLSADFHAEHYAELVEKLQRVALRWNGDTELRNATPRNFNAKL